MFYWTDSKIRNQINALTTNYHITMSDVCLGTILKIKTAIQDLFREPKILTLNFKFISYEQLVVILNEKAIFNNFIVIIVENLDDSVESRVKDLFRRFHMQCNPKNVKLIFLT